MTRLTTADTPGDTISQFFSVRSGALNYAHTTSGDLILSNETFDPVLSQYNFTLSAPTPFTNGGNGTELEHYDTPASSSFSSTFLVDGITNGYHTLTFSGGGFATGTPTPIFSLDVLLQGR